MMIISHSNQLTCTKGLDPIEFIMAVEDAFEISIPNRDAEKLDTLDDLSRYVRQRVQPGSSPECATAKMFYRLRQTLMKVTGRAREKIRPESRLDDVIPRACRAQQWPLLQQELGLRLPQLQMPGLVMGVNTALILAFFLCSAMGFIWPWLWLGCPVMVAAVALLLWRSRPYWTDLHGCQSIGDLARIVWARNVASLAGAGMSEEHVWQAIVYILSNCAGIEPSQISRELRFIDIPSDL